MLADLAAKIKKLRQREAFRMGRLNHQRPDALPILEHDMRASLDDGCVQFVEFAHAQVGQHGGPATGGRRCGVSHCWIDFDRDGRALDHDPTLIARRLEGGLR